MLSILKRIPWMLWLSLGVLFWQTGSNYWAHHWLSKWIFLVFCFSCALSYWFAKRTSWFLFPIALYALISGLHFGIGIRNPYLEWMNLMSLLALEKNALYAYVVVCAALLFLGAMTREQLRGSSWGLRLICGVSLFTTLLSAKDGPVMSGFYSGNPSMNGCLIAALLPFLFPESLVWVGVFSLCAAVAVWRTGASIPLGIFGATLAAYALSRWGKQYLGRVVGGSALLAGGLIGVGYWYLGDEFLENSGRFHMWKDAWHWLFHHHYSLFGSGLGSAQVVLPLVQLEANTSAGGIQDWFIWMHNDWFQVFFELGILGFLCAGVAWVYLLSRSYSRPVLFGSFCGFSVMALMNYPLRLPIHCFSILVICALILRTTHD